MERSGQRVEKCDQPLQRKEMDLHQRLRPGQNALMIGEVKHDLLPSSGVTEGAIGDDLYAYITPYIQQDLNQTKTPVKALPEDHGVNLVWIRCS